MSKIAWVVVIGIAALVILGLVSSLLVPLAYGRGYGYGWSMGPWMMGGFGGFGFPMMGIGMLLFWVLIIGGSVWLVQSLARGTGNSASAPQGESLFEILKSRYAKGEITKEQFEQMKRELGL